MIQRIGVLVLLIAAVSLSACSSTEGGGGGGGVPVDGSTTGVHAPIAWTWEVTSDDLALQLANYNYSHGPGWASMRPSEERAKFAALEQHLTYALGGNYPPPTLVRTKNDAALDPGAVTPVLNLVEAVDAVLLLDKASGWHMNGNAPGWITRDAFGGPNPLLPEIQEARLLRVLLREALDM